MKLVVLLAMLLFLPARIFAQHSHAAGNRDFELYLRVRERFEEIVLPKTVLDTDQPIASSVECALSALR